jgi:hypothetical protein
MQLLALILKSRYQNFYYLLIDGYLSGQFIYAYLFNELVCDDGTVL